MQEKCSINWTSVTHNLESAAVLPLQRETLIARALEGLLTCIPAAATALIWPYEKSKLSWKVSYAGIKRQSMHRWLSARLDTFVEVMISQLQHDLSSTLTDMPPFLLLPLRTLPSSPGGVWIIWLAEASTSALSNIVLDQVEHVRQTFEALLNVKSLEEHYFSTSSPLYDKDLIAALALGDSHALSAFLSLTRVVAQADFTFWAKAYKNVLEVSGHLGAKHNGFGFTLEHGHGVGGNVVTKGTPIVIEDYRNSRYRDPSVSDVVDREQIRAAIALPIRFQVTGATKTPVEAVLYATRRSLNQFTLSENLLIQRQEHFLQRLSLEKRPPSFFVPTLQSTSDHKTVWYDLVLHATSIEAVEAWAGQITKGPVIVVDKDGYPYALIHSQQLEEIHNHPETVQILSLAAPGVLQPGQVYLCPSISLPPFQWPDFFSDLVLACNAVIARMEQQQDFLGSQRQQWLRKLLQGKSPQQGEQEGYRLGLPLEHGQLWILAWSPETSRETKSTRLHMRAENVVLDVLKSPLIFLDDETAVVLLERPVQVLPSRLRDALLRHCGARPLWIVYGARYQTFPDLKMTLAHTIPLAQKARRDQFKEYILDIHSFNIDSLLENPRMTQDLDTFAKKLLKPLIEYDAANSSQFTETFVLAQTLGSVQAVAEKLGVHVNTIRYRLHKAEDILGKEQASPKEHMALALAAFIWERFALSERAE